MSRARRRISWAARRVKVSIRMRAGSTPFIVQVRDAMRQGIGLAGAGAGDDQQRPGIDAFFRGLLAHLADEGDALLTTPGFPKVAALRWALFKAVMYAGVAMCPEDYTSCRWVRLWISARSVRCFNHMAPTMEVDGAPRGSKKPSAGVTPAWVTHTPSLCTGMARGVRGAGL